MKLDSGDEKQGKVFAQRDKWQDQQHIVIQFVYMCVH